MKKLLAFHISSIYIYIYIYIYMYIYMCVCVCVCVCVRVCMCVCIIMINKYIIDFMYLMPWQFVCDHKFHEVLQKTIIRQIAKEKVEMEKIEKYSQIPLEMYRNLFMCLWVSACLCICVFVWVIVAHYCVWTYKWPLLYVCVQIHTQPNKLEVLFRIG